MMDLKDGAVNLDQLSRNEEGTPTVEQYITALKATKTLKYLKINFDGYEPTPEHHRRVIEPLCRCIANLRRHNPNHRLRTLIIYRSDKVDSDAVDLFLVAAKQYGRIRHVTIVQGYLQIQSLVKFCRNNVPLKRLIIYNMDLFCKDTAITVSQQDTGTQDSSVTTALDELQVCGVTFANSIAETTFVNFIAHHVTYPHLGLGEITVPGDTDDNKDEDEMKIARLRIVSELILQPSVQQITVHEDCRIEIMDAMESSTTVTQIQIYDRICPPFDFRSDAVQQKLQTIATRNRDLARFAANPREYPRRDLLALMRQFDGSPTGRYMLACGFVEIPSFFKIKKSTDSSKVQPKKRRY